MILQFPKQEKSDRDLIVEYARMSEGWSRNEWKAFWTEQEQNNTEMWQAFGLIMTA